MLSKDNYALELIHSSTFVFNKLERLSIAGKEENLGCEVGCLGLADLFSCTMAAAFNLEA
jgi:hypothetical protein